MIQGDPQVSVGAPNLACWWEVFGDPRAGRFDPAIVFVQSDVAGGRLPDSGVRSSSGGLPRSELLPQSQTGSASYRSHPDQQYRRRRGRADSAFRQRPGAARLAAAGFRALDADRRSWSTPATAPRPPRSTPAASPAPAAMRVGGGAGRYFNNWATSANLSWELDFWGLFRRNLEAAERQPGSVGVQLRRDDRAGAGQRGDPVRRDSHAATAAGAGPEKRGSSGTAGAAIRAAVQGRHRQFASRLCPAPVEPRKHAGPDSRSSRSRCASPTTSCAICSGSRCRIGCRPRRRHGAGPGGPEQARGPHSPARWTTRWSSAFRAKCCSSGPTCGRRNSS